MCKSGYVLHEFRYRRLLMKTLLKNLNVFILLSTYCTCIFFSWITRKTFDIFSIVMVRSELMLWKVKGQELLNMGGILKEVSKL